MFCRPAPAPFAPSPASVTVTAPSASSPSPQPGLPPTLREILEAFSKDGGGDRDLLLAILGAKRAEEERLASQLAYQAQLFQLQQQYNSALQSQSSSTPQVTPLPHYQQQQQQQQQQQPPSPVPTSPSSKSTSSDQNALPSSSRRSPSASSSSSSPRYHPYSPPSASSSTLPPSTSIASSGGQKFRSQAMAQVNANLLAKRASIKSASPPASSSKRLSPPPPPPPASLLSPTTLTAPAMEGRSRKMSVSDLLSASSSAAGSRRMSSVRMDQPESNVRGSSEEDEGEE